MNTTKDFLFFAVLVGDADHVDEDYFAVEEAGFEKTVSWNSLKTIDKKSCFARNYGGAMIWELGQDLDDNSFLYTVAAHRD